MPICKKCSECKRVNGYASDFNSKLCDRCVSKKALGKTLASKKKK